MKKTAKKLTALLVAAVMVMAMSLTAFADAPGAYKVTVYSSSGKELTDMNPFTGADVSSDGTTVTLYTKTVTVGAITGYVSKLTIDGASLQDTQYDSNNRPVAFTFYFDDGYTIGTTVNITFDITYIIGSGVHAEHSGSIKIENR